jgi:hypothetical protein
MRAATEGREGEPSGEEERGVFPRTHGCAHRRCSAGRATAPCSGYPPRRDAPPPPWPPSPRGLLLLLFFLPVDQLIVAATLASSTTLLRAAVTLRAVPLTFAVHATLLESGVPPAVVGLWEEAEERCSVVPLPTSPRRATVFLVSVSSTTRRPRSPPLGHVCGGVGGLYPWGRSIRERKGRHARPRWRALRWWSGEKA